MQKLRNNVRLIGRLGKDPQIRNLPGGKRVANFSMATSESYKNGQGQRVEETQWHNLVAWNKLADIAADYLRKGREVAVEGRLLHRKFETSDGEMRYITEINVDEILLLGRKAAEEMPEVVTEE